MAAKSVSPGAALLRTSRLFSLPAQLPPAPGDVTAASRHLSETATMPFPTLQAVASPRASRQRGDWGFKRPLPQRATTASEPLVRVKQVDTREHVTDFATATDHAVTLRKWQALNTPLTLQTDAEQRQQLAGRSVFEDAMDVVAIEPAKRHTAADKRWKFEGPWLAGITEGAFQKYLRKQVRTRRPEFREFLKGQLAADRSRAAAAEAMDKGVESDSSTATAVTAADITDAELTEYLRVLRHDRPLLYRLVGKFLDLAPVEPSDKIFQSLARSSAALAGLTGTSPSSASSGGFLSPLTGHRPAADAGPSNPWAQDGPPITHPSAGLSYLRTNAYLDNHPLYGPQKSHPPVASRIVAPRTATGAHGAKMGVAGFIAENPFGESAYQSTRYGAYGGSSPSGRTVPGLSIIDPKVPGGAKVPLRVAAAKVNSQGRVVVSAAEADPEAVLVQQELQGGERLYGEPGRLLTAREESQPRRVGRYTLGANGTPMWSGGGTVSSGARSSGSGGSTVISSPQNYGLGP